VRWLYHAVASDDEAWQRPGATYTAKSVPTEGFCHASFADKVYESARLYLLPQLNAAAGILVLQIDPRALDGVVTYVETPRGLMPHIHGGIARAAVVATHHLSAAALASRDLPVLQDEILSEVSDQLQQST
jgi:uncharacterized protein (DUF952 family)